MAPIWHLTWQSTDAVPTANARACRKAPLPLIDRIELRASREEKRILAAAAYERLDLTTFVMRSALPAAEEVVARHERITHDKDEAAARWHERFGALRLLDDSMKVVLPLATIAAALKRRLMR